MRIHRLHSHRRRMLTGSTLDRQAARFCPTS
jgi:hypothetical protein